MSDRDANVKQNPTKSSKDSQSVDVVELLQLLTTAIAGAKKPRERSKKDPEAPSPPPVPMAAELYDNVFEAIQRSYKADETSDEALVSLIPAPDFRIAAFDERGEVVPVQLTGPKGFEEARRLTITGLARLIAPYAKLVAVACNKRNFRWTAAQTKACAEYWLQHVPLLKKPPLDFAFADQKGIAWRRVNWIPTKGSCTISMNWFGRLQNGMGPVIAAWIWSIFEPLSYSQQYVWITGGGGDGKSTLSEILVDLMGEQIAFQQVGAIDAKVDKHWAVHLAVIRFLTLDEMTAADMSTREMRGITGGNKLYVRGFGSKGENYRNNLKTLCLSNTDPGIEAIKADKRRLIYAAMDPLPPETADNPRFKEEWAEELPAMLFYCREQYQRLCPNHQKIPLPDEVVEQIDEIAGRRHEEFQALYTRLGLSEQKGAYLKPSDIERDVAEYFRGQSNGGKLAKDQFYDWLRRIKGHRKARMPKDKDANRPERYWNLAKQGVAPIEDEF